MTVLVPLLSVICVENNLTAGSTRRCRQTLGNNFGFLQRILVKYRVQQLVQLLRLATQDSLFLTNHTFANKIHCDLHHGSTGTFAVTGLQEPELALLYGELHILHVAVVILQFLLNSVQFCVELRHSLFHRRILACTLLLAYTLQLSPTAAALKGDLLRSTDTCYNVLALGIYQVLTVEQVLTGSGVTAEAYTRSRSLAHVTEHHCHNRYGCTPLVRYSFHLTVEDSTLVHPAAEYSADSAPQLLNRVVGEILAGLLFDSGLETCYQELQLIYVQVFVQFDVTDLLYLFNNLLERIDVGFVHRLHAQYYVTVHLYETAIRVINEVRVVGLLAHTLCYGVIQSEVQDRIHHTRHRCTCARANRYQQRVLRITELAVHQFLYVLNGCQYIVVQEFHDLLLTYLIILVADVSRNGESRRYRYTYQVHLGAVGTFTTQLLAHLGITFGLTVTKGVNAFFVVHCVLFMLFCCLNCFELISNPTEKNSG